MALFSSSTKAGKLTFTHSNDACAYSTDMQHATYFNLIPPKFRTRKVTSQITQEHASFPQLGQQDPHWRVRKFGGCPLSRPHLSQRSLGRVTYRPISTQLHCTRELVRVVHSTFCDNKALGLPHTQLVTVALTEHWVWVGMGRLSLGSWQQQPSQAAPAPQQGVICTSSVEDPTVVQCAR